MAGSTFINISNFALLEYVYSTDTSTTEDYSFVKVKNISEDISLFLNKSNAGSFSKNVLDFSSIRLNSGTSFGSLDQDRALKLYELDTNIEYTEDLSIPTNLSLEYDTVKIHILSGYNLDNIDGISCQIWFDENSGKKVYVSSFTFIKGEKTIQNASRPFSIGDRLYDKYIEFKVPALSQLNREFYANNSATNKTLASYLSSDGKGYKRESLINIDFYYYTNVSEENDILSFDGVTLSNSYITPYDNNNLLAAVIQESDEGDYFEYFATYDGAFIEDYLAELNSMGNDYYIVNEIRVYENYGTLTNKETFNLSFVQTNDFDVANAYRPIISNNAYSFSIDYTFRLVNNADSTQIIKTSSISCDNTLAKKYGKKLNSITVKESSAPIKIYNRRINNLYQSPINDYFQDPVTVSGTPGIKVAEIIKYTEPYNVSISPISNYLQESTILENSTFTESNMVYGNGKGYIKLSRYDNYIKLLFYKNNVKDGTTDQLNFSEFLKLDSGSTESISLSFINDVGGKIYIMPEVGTIVDNSVIFYIKAAEAIRILNEKNNKFYVTYKNSFGNEITLYQGVYFDTTDVDGIESFTSKEKSKVLDEKIKAYQSVLLQIEKRIADEQNTLSAIQVAQAELSATQQTSGTTATTNPTNTNNTNVNVSSNILNTSASASKATREKAQKNNNSIKTKTSDKKAEVKQDTSAKKKLMDEANKLRDLSIQEAGRDSKFNPDALSNKITFGEAVLGDAVTNNINLKTNKTYNDNLGLDTNIKNIVPRFMQDITVI